MTYFLKKTTPSKKGLYLQIYQSMYIPGKGGRNKSYKKIGYVTDLIASGIADPIAYYQKEVDKLNSELSVEKEPQITEFSATKNTGYFLLKGVLDLLDTDTDIGIVTRRKNSRFKISDFIRSMIYAQVVSPGSKHAAYENVIPNLYRAETFSYDQILDTVKYLGEDYEKYIEVFNHHIERVFGKRKTNTAYFDCTNYFLEIDMPFEDKQKGASKENRHSPIISQALLLDEDQIPIAMKMYPGNESEKPYIRKTIEDIKERYDIDSKIVQVADKGLNCARNIYSACIESNDGYIFSKSFRGRALSEAEKKWMLLEDSSENKWINYYSTDGKTVSYRLKETVDTFEYHCKINQNDTTETKFKVKEKRVVSYNPQLAKKQIAEINAEVDKLRSKLTAKGIAREELGDSAKYVKINASTSSGEEGLVYVVIDEEKIAEAKKYAGYNLLVSSEVNKKAKEIYEAYHGLWRIEESFRVLKTYLEARPVFLQLKESIYGHFLICYLSLVVLRILELKIFNDKIPVGEIVDFIRGFQVTQARDGSFVNGATISDVHFAIQESLEIRKLGNVYLSKKDVDSFLNLHLEDLF